MRAIGTLLAACLTALPLPADTPKPDPKKTPETPAVTARHFAVFDAKGNPSSLDTVAERMAGVSVIFVGEHHDDSVAHHLELVLLKRAAEQATRLARPPGVQPRPVALALEMFERDVQDILDEYLSGLIGEQHFKDASRPWKNYVKDYRPLVEFARENKLTVLASNAPRRYVNRVGRLGAASLKDIPDPSRRGLPPLPYGTASPAYAAKFQDLMKDMHTPTKQATLSEIEKGMVLVAQRDPVGIAVWSSFFLAGKSGERPKDKGKDEEKKPAGTEHNAGRGLEAQSLWDASMAYTIAEHLLRQPRAQVIHLNGGFHSEQRMGIPEQLLRYRPGTSLLVVTILPHKSFPRFDVGEMVDRGDFVIVTDPKFPRSFSATIPEKK